jgi:hypothetical protein
MSRADDNFEIDEWLGNHSQNFYKIMIVDFNSGGASFIPVQQTAARQTGATAASGDSSAAADSQSLQSGFKLSSEPRADKVAQASALVNDSNYPSESDLGKLAGFFAGRI